MAKSSPQNWAIVGSSHEAAAFAALILARSEEINAVWVNPNEVGFSHPRKTSLDITGDEVRFVDLKILNAKDFEAQILDFDRVLFLGEQTDVPDKWIAWSKSKKLKSFVDRVAAKTLGLLSHFESDLEAEEGRRGGLRITKLSRVVLMPNPPSPLRRLLRSLQVPLEIKTRKRQAPRWKSWSASVSSDASS